MSTALLVKGLGLLIAPLVAYVAVNTLMGGYRGRDNDYTPPKQDTEKDRNNE